MEALFQHSLLQTLPQIHGLIADKYIDFCLSTSADTMCLGLQGVIQEPEILGQCIYLGMPRCRASSHLLPSHITRRIATTCFSKMSPRGTQGASVASTRDSGSSILFYLQLQLPATLPQADTPVVPTFPTQEPRSQTLILAFHPLPWLIVTLRQTPEEHLLCILKAFKRAQLDARIKDREFKHRIPDLWSSTSTWPGA